MDKLCQFDDTAVDRGQRYIDDTTVDRGHRYIDDTTVDRGHRYIDDTTIDRGHWYILRYRQSVFPLKCLSEGVNVIN